MSLMQKSTWGQLVIFGGMLIGWLVLFISNGTIFYWQDESMMMTFYVISGAAFGLLVLMNLVATLAGRRTGVYSDERDRAVFRRASLWATAVSYTVVAALLLATSITYMNRDSDSIPVYFPLFIVLAGGVVLLLIQAVVALLLYGRKVDNGQG